jgi:hypothetical protein
MLRASVLGAFVLIRACTRPNESEPRPVPSELIQQGPAPTPPAPTPTLSTACVVDPDCTMTTLGDDCCHHCGNVAVNAMSLARLTEHCAKQKPSCPAIDCPFQPATAHCEKTACMRRAK